MSFDAWGQRRSAITWEALSDQIIHAGFGVFNTNPITTRGFTGHEMMDDVGIIHMNGRIYDAKLGRFLQADPYVQSPKDTQSLNRYSYVRNNPLNATDPSGFFLKGLVRGLAKVIAGGGILGSTIGAIFPGLKPYIQAISQIVACTNGAVACSAFSATASYANTGSFNQAVKSGAIAYASGRIFQGIGDQFRDPGGLSGGFWADSGWGHIGSHALAGGVMTELQGGKFAHGFISAGIVKGFSGPTSKLDGWRVNGKSLQQATVAAVLGGTVSELSGGKFANGAITGAFQNLFNDQGDHGDDGVIDKIKRATDIDKIGELQERAFDTDQPHDVGYNPYAHEEAAYKYGEYVGSSGLVGALRTLGEVGQFFQYTVKNLSFYSFGVNLGGDRYDTFSYNYLKDSYYDIAITVDGARGVPFSEAVRRHSCGCNSPIGN